MIKKEGVKDMEVELNTRDDLNRFLKERVEGESRSVLNAVHRPDNSITLYRSAVIPFDGDIYTSVGTYSGYRSVFENAYILLGHELAHRYGIEVGNNSIPHAEANFFGILNCQSAGYCRGF